MRVKSSDTSTPCPAGFVLKSQRKALEDANKANIIGLGDLLEVEVRTQWFARHLITFKCQIRLSISSSITNSVQI